MIRTVRPQNRLLLPGSPGWDEPVSLRRRKSSWWERLLSGRDATTRLAPGTCCNCGGGNFFACGSCNIPEADLTLSFDLGTAGGYQGCPGDNSGTVTMVYTPGTPTQWISGCFCCQSSSITGNSCRYFATLACISGSVVFTLNAMGSPDSNTCYPQGTQPPNPTTSATTCCSTSSGGLVINSIVCGSSFAMAIGSASCSGTSTDCGFKPICNALICNAPGDTGISFTISA